MTLVDYSSSSDESEQNHVQAQSKADIVLSKSNDLKRKRSQVLPTERVQNPSSDLPPLPSTFQDLYATAARISTHDDPNLHGGRTRSFPHVDGNWPSHVYLEWYPSPTELTLLSDLLENLSFSSELYSLLRSDLGTPQPLHISLSQTLSLKTDRRTQFLSTLASRIQAPSVAKRVPDRRREHELEQREPEKHVGPFMASMTTLHWVPNTSADRWFLVLRVEQPPNDELNRLLHICNSVASSYGQAQLYVEIAEAPSKRAKVSRSSFEKKAARETNSSPAVETATDKFHISIAWALEGTSAKSWTDGASLEQTGPESSIAKILAEIGKLRLHFQSVKVKIGNEVHSIELSNRVGEKSKGILG